MDPNADTSQNPSLGLDVNGLMTSLIGTAGNAYIANQQSQSSISMSRPGIAPVYAPPWNPLVASGGGSGPTLLRIGVPLPPPALRPAPRSPRASFSRGS